MKMSQSGVDSLVRLMEMVVSDNDIVNVNKISNSHYNSAYLKIFLDEAEKNHNDAIGYDDFKDELWVRLQADADEYPEESNDFMRTWEAWVDLYRYLNRENKLIK